MRRIVFFGGSFDPPHMGHLALAEAAADRFALDEVLFAPAAYQPLKTKAPATPFLHRYAMTVLVTQADPRFTPSLLDAPLEGASAPSPRETPNYTVDTIARLRSSLDGETELFVLLGADSWLDIARWHDPARLLALCDWIVASRPGFSLSHPERALPPGVSADPLQGASEIGLELRHTDGHSTRVFFMNDVRVDVSATHLRTTFGSGRPRHDQLPATVEEYIRKTGLYVASGGEGIR